MADSLKISELPALTTATDDDVLAIVDQPGTGFAETKKITRANLVKDLATKDELAGKADTSAVNTTLSSINTALTGKAAGVHTHAIPDVSGLQSALDGKAATGHTHDDRYYTEAETDTLLATKAASSHTHTASQVGLSNVPNVDATVRGNHSGTQSADTIVDGTTNHVFTAADDTKLAGLELGATQNATNAQLRDRSTHTGTQPASTISDFAETVRDTMGTALVAGSNVTITADDAGDTITIAATGGGGGGTNATNLTTTQAPTTVTINSDTGTDATIPAADGTNAGVMTAAQQTKLAGIATSATANDTDANLKARANHTGTQSADTLTDGTTNKAFLATERTKLTGIATAATANSSDATLLNRANHTGTQAQSTITNLTTDLAAKAPLASPTFTGTVSGVTKAHVGLGSVDNTSDASKPISTATQTALNAKAASTHAHAGTDITTGVIPAARLGTGTTDATTVLYGDGTFKTAPAGGGGDTLPSQSGNSGKFLKTDGTALSWDTPAGGGGGSSTPRSTITFFMENPPTSTSMQSFQTSYATGGTFSLSASRFRLGLDGTANARIQMYRGTGGGNNPGSGIKNPAGHAIFSIGAVTAGDGVMYFRWFSDTNDQTSGIANQIGFSFIKVGGVTTINASSGDGTTEQSTVITGVSLASGNDHTYAFSQSATDVKFYVDGVLKATHSTNIPSPTALKNFFCLAYTKATSANPFALDIAQSPAMSFDLF